MYCKGLSVFGFLFFRFWQPSLTVLHAFAAAFCGTTREDNLLLGLMFACHKIKVVLDFGTLKRGTRLSWRNAFGISIRKKILYGLNGCTSFIFEATNPCGTGVSFGMTRNF